MPLELLDHCTFNGPALPEPFVRFELEKELSRLNLLPKYTGAEGKQLQVSWESYRRKLRELAVRGGPLRVRHCVLDPLTERLGFTCSEAAPEVETREGSEDGGFLLVAGNGAKLRTWATEFDEDLDAPAKRGAAYRFSHLRIAQRVLLASSERVGLLTNGVQLRLLMSDPARPDSEVVIPLESGWKRSRDLPDSFRFLLALCQPAGIAAVPEIVEKARLQQARVTKDLRLQAREAVERFVQEVLDHPANAAELQNYPDQMKLARDLWHEGLVLVYRLLFILKLESTDDPARSFSFTSSSLWRNTFSPGVALGTRVRDVLDHGQETGRYLEDAQRNLFRMFADGLECSELHIRPLGGALFGPEAAPLLDRKLQWGERAVAYLLDRLLWTQRKRGEATRRRVHYGALDVEDLGRVYEALLELDAGISMEPLCRLRRQKLEVVVPAAQGAEYRTLAAPLAVEDAEEDSGEDTEDDVDEVEEGSPSSSKKGKIEWIQDILPGRFFLRVGLGRKASGSYYTPHAFVRFLVQETLGPLCADRSPQSDPDPVAILKLKILDPAMGSGHFLVEACRFVAEKLYEACRLCDERADPAERRAESAIDEGMRADALAEAARWRRRVLDLPDPNDEILQYLPSRAPEGIESGISQRRAMALCRRLVAVHCLYGVDKNPLAVELAKLSLWIESHGEGLPLTFLDHRLVLGDSLTGTSFDRLLFLPSDPDKPIENLFNQGLVDRLRDALRQALQKVAELEATVGINTSDIQSKKRSKAQLDGALQPFKVASAAWSGGVMLGPAECDDQAYVSLLNTIAKTGSLLSLGTSGALRKMVERGLGVEVELQDPKELINPTSKIERCPALAYDLTFPEVFYPAGTPENRRGFDVVLGNPPWDKLRIERRELLASVDPRFLVGKEMAGAGDEHELIQEAFRLWPQARREEQSITATKRSFRRSASRSIDAGEILSAPGDLDQYRMFLVLANTLCSASGSIGFVVGGGFAKNPADTSTRRFMFRAFDLGVCVHYLNLRQLFVGASSRISFVLLAGPRTSRDHVVRLAFELRSFEDILPGNESTSQLRSLDLETVREQLRVSGDLTRLLASDESPQWHSGKDVLSALTDLGIEISNDLHRTNAKPALHRLDEVLPGATDARLPSVIGELLHRGYACSYDGRSLDQFNSFPTAKSGKWLPQVLLVADLEHPMVQRLRERIRYFRLAWRSTCGHPMTNDRSARACILPPGTLAPNSILLEKSPHARSDANAILACCVINSFCVDAQVRPVIQSHLNKGVISTAFWPTLNSEEAKVLVHSGVRLLCNTSSFLPLWSEQLGGNWRETGAAFSWPVLQEMQERWKVRAVIEALIAVAYGLSDKEFTRVLSLFDHSDYPQIPDLCLTLLRELTGMGFGAFATKHDPYWDIPLNESLPAPVIELPGMASPCVAEADFSLSSPTSAAKKARRRK